MVNLLLMIEEVVVRGIKLYRIPCRDCGKIRTRKNESDALDVKIRCRMCVKNRKSVGGKNE